MKFVDAVKMLEKHCIPIPIPLEKATGKKVKTVFRYGTFDEPAIIFDDNTALIISRHYYSEDVTADLDVYQESQCLSCGFGLDIGEYLDDLKDLRAVGLQELKSKAAQAYTEYSAITQAEKEQTQKTREQAEYLRLKNKYEGAPK